MTEEDKAPPPPAGEAGAKRPGEREGADSGAASPLRVKTRLPFEQKELARHPGVRAAAFVYGAAALIMAGVAVYMAFVVGRPLTSVPVFAPALGALYFAIRVAMMLRPKI